MKKMAMIFIKFDFMLGFNYGETLKLLNVLNDIIMSVSQNM